MKLSAKILSALLVAAMLASLCATGVFAYADAAAETTCTVTFSANGGSGGPGVLTRTGAFAIPSDVPTRAGMVFRGWATSYSNAMKGTVAYSYNAALGGSATYDSGISATLYASWAYEVTLNCGSEGWGSTAYKLYKFPAIYLPLLHNKNDIRNTYGMLPGKNVTGDQRVFIQWSTSQNTVTGKGTGTSYYNYYSANAPATLYCIWGYPIQYNADGGTFPVTGSDIVLTYVCGYDGQNYQNPKTLYGNFDFPEGANKPVKEGCRMLTMSSGAVFYLLRYSDGRACTTETAGNNLTIPPSTTSGLNWSNFHTTTDRYGRRAVEFHAVWEPSVTYKANGGSGSDFSEYLEFDWQRLYHYSDYTIMTAASAASRFTRGSCTFLGWNTASDGSGTAYTPGAIINQLSSSDPIVLYAQWSECASHTFGDWVVTTPATTTAEGVETRVCTVCDAAETRALPLLEIPEPVLSVDNYTVRIENAQGLNYIRYAGGELSTLAEIRAASDLVQINEGSIGAATVNGVFTHELANGGKYTFWLRCDNGSEYILHVDASVMTQSASAFGVRITVNNLYGVKDYFIAPGHYTTYRDTANNSVMRVTPNDFGTAHSYTYTVAAAGEYTIWVRYSDISREPGCLYVNCEVISPVITANGLQVSIGNTEGARVVRIAPGEWNTPGEIKRAPGCRNFTSRAVSAADPYVIQCSNNGVFGTYTVSVEYTNGYREVHRVNVTKKAPSYTVTGNTITLTGLDGMSVVRWAGGEYATSYDVKRAPGARYAKPASLVDGALTLALESGTYTFVVQYDDASVSLFVVTVN